MKSTTSKKIIEGLLYATIAIMFVTFCWFATATLLSFRSLESYTVYSYTYPEQEFKVTAYCPCEKCCEKYADGITASGYKLRKGNKLCAANFDFCTVLKIPGYGIAPVLDRGGAIKEDCIDVYFDTHQEALEWGVQYLKIRIIK